MLYFESIFSSSLELIWLPRFSGKRGIRRIFGDTISQGGPARRTTRRHSERCIIKATALKSAASSLCCHSFPTLRCPNWALPFPYITSRPRRDQSFRDQQKKTHDVFMVLHRSRLQIQHENPQNFVL
uniref:(northern house mosquito) hypothetical protein n=1 Tax=Culex pipiens TaxID=7175 RepID=A0A8D8NB09_CULPI